MDLIQQSFAAKGVQLYSGEIVDVSDFTNIKVLRDHNYTVQYAGNAYKCAICGRLFNEEHLLGIHSERDHAVEAPATDSEDVTGVTLTEVQTGVTPDLIPPVTGEVGDTSSPVPPVDPVTGTETPKGV